MADFFNDKQEEATPEKIKLGETEFTTEELQDLVGRGKKLKEIEDKQGQPVDEILKSWGRRGETIGEYKKKLEEYEKTLEEAKKSPPSKEEIDIEKQKEQVIKEAREFGLLTKAEAQEMFNQLYQTQRGAEKIFSAASKVLKQAAKEGKPSTEVGKLLEFMADPENPKNPEKAYKLMFEKELDEFKEKQLATLKKPGMITDTTSPAAKNPERKILRTGDELKLALQEALTREG